MQVQWNVMGSLFLPILICAMEHGVASPRQAAYRIVDSGGCLYTMTMENQH